MQSSHEIAIFDESLSLHPCSNNDMVRTSINGAFAENSSSNLVVGHNFQLSIQDLEVLFRFQNRTALSFPGRLTKVYKYESLRLMALVRNIRSIISGFD